MELLLLTLDVLEVLRPLGPGNVLLEHCYDVNLGLVERDRALIWASRPSNVLMEHCYNGNFGFFERDGAVAGALVMRRT